MPPADPINATVPTALTRREFAGSLAALAVPQAAPPRCNLLLITCDQFRADCLGVMGNPVIRTPNLDRLAAEGALFEQHYVQCPQCVPSRAAMHTGRYPHVNRTRSNADRLPESEQTLATVLGRHGYTTAVVGELPFAPTNVMGGFETLIAGYTEYQASLLFGGWALKGVMHASAIKQHFTAVPSPWPDDVDESGFFAAKAIEFIGAHRETPFFLHVNWRRPHYPFDPPPPFDSMYAGVSFPPSHQRAGEMKNKPPAQQQALANTNGFDLRTLTGADIERIKSYYYGMISENDKHIGRILDSLRQTGIADRTVVVFNSDHGEMLGDHGLLFKSPGYYYDEVVRAPLIVRAPARAMGPGLGAGKRIGRLVEEIDLMPTLLELLGIDIPRGVQGRSLAGGPPRQAVHSEFPGSRMLRTEAWKLVEFPGEPYGELYNLRKDPHELFNLWDDAAARPSRRQLQAELAEWWTDSLK